LRVLVTGGAGFIGSALVRALMARPSAEVLVLDKLTYAACPGALDAVEGQPGFRLVQADVADEPVVRDLLADFVPDSIVHLAAETHVDRSIDAPATFVQTNVVGTSRLLDAVLDYWRQLPEPGQRRFRFHHVSTDEVFGPAAPTECFGVDAPYRPTSPYAASKAAADHLVRAWHLTYGLPVVVSNASNNYGPYQFPEKLIPLSIIRAVRGEPIRIYGSGEQMRDWIHVDDHVSGLVEVLQKGRIGAAYNLASGHVVNNLQVVRMLCAILDEMTPVGGRRYAELITHVADRPGHDVRYALDIAGTRQALDWRPNTALEDGLRATVRWYLDHADWWEQILATRYGGERLGAGDPANTQDAANAVEGR